MKVLETSDKINKKGYYPPKAVKEDECLGCRLCELLCPEFAIIIINE
jgi:2-oxoglutarate ferredoxin oxidoreductase subunit delta